MVFCTADNESEMAQNCRSSRQRNQNIKLLQFQNFEFVLSCYWVLELGQARFVLFVKIYENSLDTPLDLNTMSLSKHSRESPRQLLGAEHANMQP